MHNQEENISSTWRNNWFAKNWLTAIPLARIITKDNLTQGIDTLLSDTFMLAGGTAVMLLNIFDLKKDENIPTKIIKINSAMIVGMGSGMMMYNTLKFSANKIKESCSTINSEQSLWVAQC